MSRSDGDFNDRAVRDAPKLTLQLSTSARSVSMHRPMWGALVARGEICHCKVDETFLTEPHRQVPPDLCIL